MEHFHQVTEDLRAPYRELTQAIPGVISGYGAIHTAAMAVTLTLTSKHVFKYIS